jgi:hypothetical protein
VLPNNHQTINVECIAETAGKCEEVSWGQLDWFLFVVGSFRKASPAHVTEIHSQISTGNKTGRFISKIYKHKQKLRHGGAYGRDFWLTKKPNGVKMTQWKQKIKAVL